MNESCCCCAQCPSSNPPSTPIPPHIQRGSNNGGAKKAPRPLAAASSSSSTSPPPKKQLWHPKQNRAAATTNHPEKRLLQQVNSAVNYKQLPTALARLRELNALSLPLPQEQIQNAVLSVLQLCQTSVRRPQEGTDAALEILAMERLAALLDKDCMAQAFQLIDTRDPTTWAHTLSFLERVLAHLPPTAWPSQQIYRHALRHLADAGRPDEVKWVLRMMLTHGGPDRYGIGSMGRRHSPAWHLIKAYLYAHQVQQKNPPIHLLNPSKTTDPPTHPKTQPIAAVQLLKREEGLVLDVDTFAFVLKGLAREKLGPAAAAFLQWGEEEAGVATTTEAYNYVMIALAKANRHIIRQRYSFPPTHPLPSIAEEEGAMRRNIGLGRQMLARMRLRGVKPDMTTFCALIDAYSEARDTDGAIAVFFEEMVGKARLRPTDVAFGTLMKAFSRQTDWRRTLACLEAMHELKLEDKMVRLSTTHPPTSSLSSIHLSISLSFSINQPTPKTNRRSATARPSSPVARPTAAKTPLPSSTRSRRSKAAASTTPRPTPRPSMHVPGPVNTRPPSVS